MNSRDPWGVVILVATRERPKGMRRLVESVQTTVDSRQRVNIVFGIDADDEESRQTACDLAKTARVQVRAVHVEPSAELNLARISNILYAASDEPIVGCFGDDVVFRTQGWDAIVRHEFQKNIAILLFGNDRLQKGRLATHFFTHRRIHDALGYYMNEKFRRIYIDTWWDHIFRSQKRDQYVPDLIFEHLHPETYPENEDDLYRRNAKWMSADEATWKSEENQKDLRREMERFRWLIWKLSCEKIRERLSGFLRPPR